MARNVCEWASSVYKPDPYSAGDGREWAESTENRGLRGGSWNLNARLARAASRSNVYVRGDLGGAFGFRVALAAPISCALTPDLLPLNERGRGRGPLN
jgi:formylglycine-generating enzyme required for sulfatase activity